MLKLLLEYCAKFFTDEKVKDVFVKLGMNFVTAGIVGVFINRIAGSEVTTMRLTAGFITYFGMILLMLGLRR